MFDHLESYNLSWLKASNKLVTFQDLANIGFLEKKSGQNIRPNVCRDDAAGWEFAPMKDK